MIPIARPRRSRPGRRRRGVALALLAAVAWSVAACGDDGAAARARASAAYDRAVAHAQAGRLAPARDALAESLRDAPEVAHVRKLYGVVLERLDDVEGAEREMREAVRLAPDDPDARLHLARIERKRALDARIALAHHRASEAPDDVALRYALGELLLERGRFDGALVELLRAERRGGSDARSNALLGLAYAGQQRHVRALHHLSEALRLGSDDPRVRAELVFLLATSRADDLRDPERALREAAPALEGAPTARLLDGVAAAYAAVGRRADADAAIARAIARAVADDDHVSAHEMEQRRARYRAGDTWLGPPVDPT